MEITDEVEKEFEEYFSKTRGLTIAAFGLDIAGKIETAARLAFLAGYTGGLSKAERMIRRP